MFNRFSKGNTTIHLKEVEQIALKGLGIYLDKRELMLIKARVNEDSATGEVNFKLFQELMHPFMEH